MNNLEQFGWTDDLQQVWDELGLSDVQPARVIADFGVAQKIAVPAMEMAEFSDAMAHRTDQEERPKVGDWVAVRLREHDKAVIETVMPRRSEIARKVPGKRTVKQIIATNVDVAFVLLALDNDFSVERLKRFLYQLSIHSIAPVIVLNKADKVDDVEPYLADLRSLELPIVICTATEGTGVAEVMSFIRPGRTGILLGSSGVGKSTLTNQLLQREAQATQAVRESDDTGRHTTVHREIFMLPNGGLLIDTPGIRELQLWGTEEELDDNFDDIAALALQCTYTTCRHGSEPGCAIQAALQSGELQPAHYANYTKMKHELSELERKTAIIARRADKKPQKNSGRQARSLRDDE